MHFVQVNVSFFIESEIIQSLWQCGCFSEDEHTSVCAGTFAGAAGESVDNANYPCTDLLCPRSGGCLAMAVMQSHLCAARNRTSFPGTLPAELLPWCVRPES